MRPLLPTRSYNLIYPYVTSNTPAFGRTATPARVRSPMHTDRVLRHESVQVLRSRVGGTPWRCFGSLARPRLVSWRKAIVVSPVGRMKDTREASMGPLGGTSVGSQLATYETLGSLPFSWQYLATLHLTHKRPSCFYPCSCGIRAESVEGSNEQEAEFA